MKQSIIDKILPKNWSVAKVKKHDQVFEDAKFGKKGNKFF